MSRLMLVIGSLLLTTQLWAFDPLLFTSENQKLKLEPIFQTDDVIWAFKFLPDQRILFSERSGNLKIFDPNTKTTTKVSGVPKVHARGQGGLLDMALHPDFSKNKVIYFTFSEAEKGKNTTAIARATLEGNALKNLKIIFRAQPLVDSNLHFGSRLVFDDQGYLFFCMGERNEREFSQKLDNHLGKVLRLTADGEAPKDNPFVKTAGALPEIWSYGHRNPQGMIWIPERKELLAVEHGPRGGDEINIIKPGKNYGWPVITYGREYWGPKIGKTHQEGMEQPLKYYVPSIAPSNLVYYNGNKIKAWKGNLLVGALVLTHLNRVVIKDNQAIKEEQLLKEWGQRIRDVQQGPDEWIYLATDGGYLARIVTAN